MKRLFAYTVAAATIAMPARAQTIGADPAGSSPITAALQWGQGTMLGNLATAAAVIAIAAIGFMMLTGLIIFGAVGIVQGLRSFAGGMH